MPVYTAQKEEVLVITVDGDYTSSELRRVGGAAVDNPEPGSPARILLDVSGAAGLSRRPPAEFMEVAGFFAAMGEKLDGVAVLAPDDASFNLLRMGMRMYAGRGLRAQVFRARPDALEWLKGGTA